MQIDIAIELTRVQIEFSEQEGKKFRIACPFHDDDTPSLDIFKDSSNFHCHACKKSGNFATLLACIESRPRYIVESDLVARYGDTDTPVDPDQVERYHRAIWDNNPINASLRASLAYRCVDDAAIRQFRLGVDVSCGRIVIPIDGPGGNWVTLRRYLPDLPKGDSRPKMTNQRGRGKRMRIYPFEQLRFSKIMLCGGEMKAIAAAQVLNPLNIGAVCLTGGEGNWSMPLEAFFAGKQMLVCTDVDTVGIEATNFRCARLSPICPEVRAVWLPLDLEEHPKGDINDYLRVNGPDEFIRIVNEAEIYVPPIVTEQEQKLKEDTAEPQRVAIQSVNDPSIVNKRIQCEVAVSAMGQNIYYIPKKIKVACNKDQDACPICPVFLTGKNIYSISAESPAILAMVDSPKRLLNDEIREALKIPKCHSAQFESQENYKITEVRVQQGLDLTENDSDKTVMPALVVDSEIELNETYDLVGRSVPNPKSQIATIIASKVVAVQDALSSYDPGDTQELLTFRPKEWTVQAIDDVLDPLYNFYAHNVTRIYERPTLHKFVDLTFHSVLSMNVYGEDVKGTLELLIVGDSGQGKSKVTYTMRKWLGLGEEVDCKNATVAGILGGLEHISGKWFASWGVVPTHDRRLVVFEELKGLAPEVFAKLTQMRSSQVAEIPKIIRSRARARTRLIVVSNPKRQQISMSGYAFGIKAVPELVPNPEDVRRFDACIILNKGDIDSQIPNTMRAPIKEVCEAETARQLVLWAWTRKTEEVIFTEGTLDLAFNLSNYFCRRFTDSIPLVDNGGMRFKILRWAAACAARTFSADETGTKLLIRPCHVEWICKLLNDEYSSETNGYLLLSEAINGKIGEVNETEIASIIMRQEKYQELVSRLLNKHDIDDIDFSDWCGWSKEEARTYVSMLVRENALIREGKFYNKSAAFVDILRKIQNNEIACPIPAHITNGEMK